jgi:multicomponent Na+:H+ antiporter subunit F
MMAAIIVVATMSATAAAFVRLLRGPTQADRVIAVELMFSSAVMLAAAAAVQTGRALLLDVGIGLALVGFVGTVAWARIIDAPDRGSGS